MPGTAAVNGGVFIMKAGETQAQMYVDAFSEYAEIFEFLDMCGYHMPADISADGNRIIGNGWYSPSEDPYADDTLFYFMTYVIDRGVDSGGQSNGNELNDAVPTEYFTIDGLRIEAPVKGLNIIRMSDGSIRKAIHD